MPSILFGFLTTHMCYFDLKKGEIKYPQDVIRAKPGQLSPQPMLSSEDWWPPSPPVPPPQLLPFRGRSLDTVPSVFRESRSQAVRELSQDTQWLNGWAHGCPHACCPHLKIKHKVFLDFLWVCIIDDGNFPYRLGWLQINYSENKRTSQSLSPASFAD